MLTNEWVFVGKLLPQLFIWKRTAGKGGGEKGGISIGSTELVLLSSHYQSKQPRHSPTKQ